MMLCSWLRLSPFLLIVAGLANSFALSILSTTMGKKTEKLQPSILFVTNKMCPFAQKAWIVLEATKIPYKVKHVSLYGAGGKPDWFWKLNPQGQVPVLVIDDDTIIADSDRILDEFASTVPSSLLINQQQCALEIDAFRSKLNEFLPIGKAAVLGGDRQQMWKKLIELDNLMVGHPYIVGDKITIADAAAFPFLWRINEEFSGSCWKKNGCHNIPVWLDHCSKQQPFSTTIQSSWWWWW